MFLGKDMLWALFSADHFSTREAVGAKMGLSRGQNINASEHKLYCFARRRICIKIIYLIIWAHSWGRPSLDRWRQFI